MNFLTRNSKLINLLFAVISAMVLIVLLTGCAAGRGPAGEIIIGAKVGTLPETGSELLNAAAGAIGTSTGLGWLSPLLSLLGVVGVGGAGHYLANKGRDRTDAQYDEGFGKGVLAGMAKVYTAPRPVTDPLVDPPTAVLDIPETVMAPPVETPLHA